MSTYSNTYYKVKAQEEIKRAFPERLERYKKELCESCLLNEEQGYFTNIWACARGLIPVTGNGGRCPYFDRKGVWEF
jgi:hypothetical protein